jgi:hypothetical protein
MTTPTIVPTGFANDSTDFLKTVRDTFGAARVVTGTASVTSGTAADAFVGLVPFNKGATFKLDSASVHCGNFGAGSTTVNVGIIYDDNATYTNDPDAFASASTAPQSGGFVTIDEIEGLTLETEANGWLAVQLKTAAADATADVTFSVIVKYD